jgi:Cyclin-dependent kinase inhibitor 3 (CDKN3)
VWPYDEELHAWWVEPGRLLAGAYPSSNDAAHAQRKLDLLVGAGVDSIVDLTTPHDPLRPYETALKPTADKAGRALRHFSYPIPDMGVVDDAGYDAILAVIRDELDARRTVYVHCWGGKGRTTTVIGCLLADTGLIYQAVIARIAALRAGTRKADSLCPETSVQRDVIRRRCDRAREQNR